MIAVTGCREELGDTEYSGRLASIVAIAFDACASIIDRVMRS